MRNIYFLLVIMTIFSSPLIAANITAVQNGNWNTNSTWDLIRKPMDNDVVIIPFGISVSLNNSPYPKNNPAGRPTLQVEIYGILDFSGAGTDKLYLDVNSIIQIHTNGKIQTGINGNEIIAIYNGSSDNTVWNGNPSTVNGPAFATSGSFGFLNGVLPLTLVSFDVTKTGKGFGKLFWITSEESNASHFEIESFETNSNRWLKKGEIRAAGNSTSSLNYSFNVALSPGLNLFRLKMSDIDGKYVYSQVRILDNTNNDGPRLYFIRNARQLQFEGLESIKNSKINVSVFDFNGREILKDLITSSNNSLHLSSVSAGCYIVQLKAGSGVVFTQKILVY